MKRAFSATKLLALMLVLCSLAGCVSRKYVSTASILVTNGAVITSYEETTDKIFGSDITASVYLADTVVDLLNTTDIYKKVADELGGDYTYQSLMDCSKVVRRGESTLFIDVTFSSTDPKEAMRLANKFVEIACGYITDFIPSARANVASTAIRAQKQGLF